MAATGRLQGKVALVTGAGSGIGKETATRFAAEGAQVVCADLLGDEAIATATEIGTSALGIEMDVTVTKSIKAGLKQLLRQFGSLDCVINNAGVTIVGAAHEMEEDDWDRELDTNLKSVYLVTKAAWPHLVEGGGSIASTASIAGIWAIPADAATRVHFGRAWVDGGHRVVIAQSGAGIPAVGFEPAVRRARRAALLPFAGCLSRRCSRSASPRGRRRLGSRR